MAGQNFPVSDRYKGHILDAVTINRRGNWWTAVLVIDEPGNGTPFMQFYKWQKRGDEWKRVQSFKINKRNHLDKISDAIRELAEHLQ